MSQVWSVDLPPGDKLVLLALADCANDEGKCWPGLSSLAAKTGKCRRSLIDSIHALEKAGHLSRDILVGKGTNYTIHPRTDEQLDLPIAGAKSAPVQKTHRCKNRRVGGAKSAPKPLGTISSSEAKASSPRAKFDAPPGVAEDQWEAFRKQRRKALNERSYTLLTNKLRKLAEDGWPPGEMIDLAIERGWETVFAPRNFANERSANPTGDALARVQAAIRGRSAFG